MRRLIYLTFGSALLFGLGATPAFADNGPHHSTAAANGSTNVTVASAGTRCASCHRAHTAQGSYLLRQDGVALCTTCHGGGAGATTDVMDGISTNGSGALRGGGFEYAAIGTHTATKSVSDGTAVDPYNGGTVSAGRAYGQVIPVLTLNELTTSKHSVGEVGTIWANGALNSGAGKTGVTLECTSCHDPHGNGNYRILKAIPSDSGAATGVDIPDVTGQYVYTTANYWLTGDSNAPQVNVSTGATPVMVDAFTANVAQWCSQCHTRDLASSGSYKTPSGDEIYMYRHRSDRNTKLAGNANCITCHVAHGTNAVETNYAGQHVALPDGTVGSGRTDSRLLRVDDRGTCFMCHNV